MKVSYCQKMIFLLRNEIFQAARKPRLKYADYIPALKFFTFFCLIAIQITDLPTIITDSDVLKKIDRIDCEIFEVDLSQLVSKWQLA
jgi:hypothetical protein